MKGAGEAGGGSQGGGGAHSGAMGDDDPGAPGENAPAFSLRWAAQRGARPVDAQQAGGLRDTPYSSSPPGLAGTSTACSWSAASGTMSSARSWVAASTTGAATPSWWAQSQFAAVTHQRSPGISPGKRYAGAGLDRSLPIPR